MAAFTVDTHIFRELGELLVGRDSTALVELIKNAYDADATYVTVYGEALSDSERGFLRITDNGSGMSPTEFTQGFLRIAARTKDHGSRRSRRFQRRFTGAKGIGRLAAHKLARIVEVHSVPQGAPEEGVRCAVEARIDWDAVEAQQTIAEIDDQGVSVREQSVAADAQPGTTITLRRLRGKWSPAMLGRFLAEVQAFTPSPLTMAPLQELLDPSAQSAPLFQIPRARDADVEQQFTVALEGELSGGDNYWTAIRDVATWVLDIDALSQPGVVRYAIAPTRRYLEKHPWIGAQSLNHQHPDPKEGPFFQARILCREEVLRGTQTRAWAERVAGIRVFMEGFRVLPYGEPSDDWLRIDRDVAAKLTSLPGLKGDVFDDLEAGQDREGLKLLPSKHYVGSVLLTQEHATSLRMLVNREGFVPEAGYEHLVDLVRRGVDLLTRRRAAVRADERYPQPEPAARPTAAPSRSVPEPSLSSSAPVPRPVPPPETKQRLITEVDASKGPPPAIHEIVALVKDARSQAAAGAWPAALATITHLDAQINTWDAATQATGNAQLAEGSMVRVLASVGMQMAGFVHEIQGLLALAQLIEVSVSRLRDSGQLPAKGKAELSRILGTLGDLRRRLERQATFLTEVVTPDARRRRSRQALAERFDATWRMLQPVAQQRGITVRNEIPADLRTPPMFLAEVTAVLSNLLTNAVKAAGPAGQIRAVGSQRVDGAVLLRIENSGVAVDLAEAERWFRPFESTTTEVHAVLGQGMGLGLPITRALLEEYGAEIAFVPPSSGFATAVQLTFPK